MAQQKLLRQASYDTIALFALCAVVLLAANAGATGQADNGLASSPQAGGHCAYGSFQGTCKILSVTRASESRLQKEIAGDPGYEGFKVIYTFHPEVAVDPDSTGWDKEALSGVLKKENVLLLANGWYPGQKYLEKYHIAEGSDVACQLNLITQGTCSPIVYTFTAIDTADYFEQAGNR